VLKHSHPWSGLMTTVLSTIAMPPRWQAAGGLPAGFDSIVVVCCQAGPWDAAAIFSNLAIRDDLAVSRPPNGDAASLSNVQSHLRGQFSNSPIPPGAPGGVEELLYPVCLSKRALISAGPLSPHNGGVSSSLQENVPAREHLVGNEGLIGKLNAHTDDERELIDRAQAGDAVAFERLAERHVARMWRCALVLAKDRHWAEDLVQETLVEAWGCLARFEGRSRFSTWLYGVLRHRFLKGRQRQSTATLTSPDAFDQVACAAYMPDRFAEASEDAQRVRRAVASLPERYRLVIDLHYFAGATLDEVATALDLPLGTVKSRLNHSLRTLRQMNLAVNCFCMETGATTL
jgi:RNA polymerase sigma-70 factor, ECF subfamily